MVGAEGIKGQNRVREPVGAGGWGTQPPATPHIGRALRKRGPGGGHVEGHSRGQEQTSTVRTGDRKVPGTLRAQRTSDVIQGGGLLFAASYSEAFAGCWRTAWPRARCESQSRVTLAAHPVTRASVPVLASRVSSRRVTAQACGFVSVRPHVAGSMPCCPSQSLFRSV